MKLYNILVDILGYTTGTGVNYNSTIMNIAGVIIVLCVIWFLDCLTRLFLRH